MAEYIEREAALAEINRYTRRSWPTISGVESIIKNQLAADVAPVRHGHWIDGFIPDSMLCGCSECGFTCGAHSFLYCPMCGARMYRKVGDDNAVD